MRVLSGDPPGPPLEDLIARVQSPTLLISAGEEDERDFNVVYEKGGARAGRAMEPARRVRRAGSAPPA